MTDAVRSIEQGLKDALANAQGDGVATTQEIDIHGKCPEHSRRNWPVAGRVRATHRREEVHPRARGATPTRSGSRPTSL